MHRFLRWGAAAAAVTGCAVTGAALWLWPLPTTGQLTILAGCLMPCAAVALLIRRLRPSTERRPVVPEEATPICDRDRLDEIRAELEAQSRRIDQQRQELHHQMVRFREFQEYPREEESEPDEQAVELSEKDRAVNRLLEQEAARVYEKIRSDGYRCDGRLDIDAIRRDVLDVIRKVARIYQPDSTSPLLETSIDQLARAASRICLQTLVLAEQLPVDIRHYTLTELYGYVRKAVSAWGTWKTVSPWLTRISRGLYAGRIATGASPVTFGAWWLASELGRHGTRKLVDHYVDQRAVAFLHDVLRVIGYEVAGVYGPGIRQRDPAWILGTELVELTTHFPVSRKRLQAALTAVTGLPLRSEYDRVYLYRCLAEHRSSGFFLTDPTILTRDERESIARQLEQFFAEHLQEAADDQVEAWKCGVEERLDLRLTLSRQPTPNRSSSGPREILSAIHSFLTAAAGLSAQQSVRLLSETPLWRRLPTPLQQQLTSTLSAAVPETFHPPELDPAESLTDDFLRDLTDCICRGHLFDRSLETLLVETGRYFRRSEEEIRRLITDAWKREADRHLDPQAPVTSRRALPARQILQLLTPNTDETVEAVYTNITTTAGPTDDDDQLWLIVVKSTAGRRTLMFRAEDDPQLLWQGTSEFTVERAPGFVTDDAAVCGGQWIQTDRSADPGIILFTVAGKFGSSFRTWFAPLLQAADHSVSS